MWLHCLGLLLRVLVVLGHNAMLKLIRPSSSSSSTVWVTAADVQTCLFHSTPVVWNCLMYACSWISVLLQAFTHSPWVASLQHQHQTNSASYPKWDGTWVAAYTLWGVSLDCWIWAADCASKCTIVWPTDGCIVCRGTISTCHQTAATSETVKLFWSVTILTYTSSTIASTLPGLPDF